MPLTYSYNFTIDQQLPWKILLDVAYVGNQAHKLSDTGASLTTGGQLNLSYANQNKTPLGAYFKPDPITQVTSCNPENISGLLLCRTTPPSDYQPYGKVQSAACANTGSSERRPAAPSTEPALSTRASTPLTPTTTACRLRLVKRQGPVTLNINATYSKSLAIINNYNPFNLRLDYGYDTGERPFIFSSSYIYRSGNFYHGNRFLAGAINGWTVSGISTWQQGANTLPGLNIQYDAASSTSYLAGTPGVQEFRLIPRPVSEREAPTTGRTRA